MSTATLRIPEEKRDLLKIIASVERREMKDIIAELIDEYVERHQETLELLSRPEWVDEIRKGRKEVLRGVKGKSLADLAG
jgi:predicted transcriptional regulator